MANSKSKAVSVKVVKTPAVTRQGVLPGSNLSRGSVAPRPDPRIIFVQADSVGSSGTQIYAGYFAEEYLVNELSGTAAADLFDKMRRSDAKMKMALKAVKAPIMSADWSVHPAGDSKEEKAHAEFITHVLFKDMDRPFSKWETLSLADFGHCVFEITHKPVMGHPLWGDYIGLASLGWRSPRSIDSWQLNPQDGRIDCIRQLAQGDMQRYVDIPGQFLLVASLEKEGDLYEGVSLMRAALGAWKRKNLYLKLMAIGGERNAIPTPWIEVPNNKQKSTQYTNMVNSFQNYTSHQSSFLAIPAGWKHGFIDAPFDPEKLKTMIDFENSEMVSAFEANFLLLGSTQTGSRAVSTDQSDFFLNAIQYVADEAVTPHNHKLIPELIKMKFGPQEAYPTLKISGISDKAGAELAESLNKLVTCDVVQPDDELEEHVRKRYKLSKKSAKGARVAPAKEETPQEQPEKPEKVKFAEARLKWAIRLSDMETRRVRFQASGHPNCCEVCLDLDGKTFDVDDAPELPIHPNCECSLVEDDG